MFIGGNHSQMDVSPPRCSDWNSTQVCCRSWRAPSVWVSSPCAPNSSETRKRSQPCTPRREIQPKGWRNPGENDPFPTEREGELMKTLEDCINLGENYVKLEEFRTKVCARLIKTGDQREHQISAKEVLFQCGEIKGETFAAIQDAPGMRKIWK